MRNLLHFLLGSVKIEVTGPFPERFLNLCGAENVAFWGVKQWEENRLTVHVLSHKVNQSRKLARQALCQVRVLEGNGLPCFLFGLRRRYALLAGLACALFGAIVLSQYVWVVEVTGNESVSDSVILTELEKQGFGPGTLSAGVDRRELANDVLLELPQLSFLSVNISGIYARVVVREAAPEPEVEDRWAPGDVVAGVDGVVINLDPVIGSSVVEEGQGVLKGETLISGTEEHHSGDGTGQVLSTTQVRAEGRVKALTLRTLRCATPLVVSVRETTGEKKRIPGLRFGRRSMKFGRESSFFTQRCARITKVYPLTLPGGKELPIAFEYTELTEYALGGGKLKRTAAEEFLRSRLEERLRALMGEEGQVLSRDIALQEEDGVLIGTLTASCVEDIGVMVPRDAQPSQDVQSQAEGVVTSP